MYLVFGGNYYYPRGGASDLIDVFNDKESAIKRSEEIIDMFAATDIDEDGREFDLGHNIDWSHVYGCEEGKIVYGECSSDKVIEVYKI